ncbi:hypothetical protein HPB47_007322 [Ixodes persulcatus]|uniref:Uncharacterized protein n=1 Tax=Ixodes persulcatus TaxID=34615 RepID=A0AC60P7S5_IXOPE|nr:hypothetical protein HPB47_007322 [Ixodes persulcatus]
MPFGVASTKLFRPVECGSPGTYCYQDGVLLSLADVQLQAANGDTALRLSHLTREDSGCYLCAREGGINSSVLLRVLSPMVAPAISDEAGSLVGPKLGPLVEGDSLTLLCLPPPEFSGALLRWRPDPRRLHGTSLSDGRALLHIAALGRRHQGLVLLCTVNHPVAGTASASVTLDMLLAPVGATLVRRGPLVAGVSAELECVTWGSRPEALVNWTLGGVSLPTAFVHWDGNVSTATVSLLPTASHDGLRLTCSAANPRAPTLPAVQDSRVLDVRSHGRGPEVVLTVVHGCLNDRVREHANEIKKAASDTSEISYHPIAKHTSECSEPCSADLPSTTRIGGHASRYGREIMEAFAMHHSQNNLGSPSIGLSRREINFLGPELTSLVSAAPSD